MKFATLSSLSQQYSSFWNTASPSSADRASLQQHMKELSRKGEWLEVVDLSSRAVVHLAPAFDECLEFYASWIEALHALKDDRALRLLSKHLSKVGKQYAPLLALASLGAHFAQGLNPQAVPEVPPLPHGNSQAASEAAPLSSGNKA